MTISYVITCEIGIVLSVLLRYTGSDYPFGIFKLFLGYIISCLRWNINKKY